MLVDSDSATIQTLPVWLQDVLLNELSFWRSGMFSTTEDGDSLRLLTALILTPSVNNHFQREIPYVLFYPKLVENAMRPWAEY